MSGSSVSYIYFSCVFPVSFFFACCEWFGAVRKLCSILGYAACHFGVKLLLYEYA